MRKLWFLLFCLVPMLGHGQSYVLIRDAYVADVVKQKWNKNDILISEDKILAVGKDLAIPGNASARIIDATGKYIVPGLQDAHIHFFQSGGLFTRPDALNLGAVRSYSEELKWVRSHADEQMKRYLASGVTSVIDCGGPFWNFEVKTRSREQWMNPKVAVAGPLISTYQPPNLDTLDPPIIRVTTPAQVAQLVDKQAPYKPDFIKIWYIVQKGEKAEDHLPIIRAVKERCKFHGLRLAVHATELETARLAVMEGADILVHSVFDKEVDDAFIKLLKEKRVIYIPTLSVKEGYEEAFGNKTRLDAFEHRWANPEMAGTLFKIAEIPDSLYTSRVKKLLADTSYPALPEVAMRNLKKLNDAGVIIATGTDAGNIGTLHGPAIIRELEMMHLAGMSSWDIIKASTANAALVTGSKSTGAIEKGMFADLLILHGNPAEDFLNLFEWDTLIINGKPVNRNAILPQDPVSLVQRQVNAYNEGNIISFLECFSEDCEIFEFEGGKLIMKGHEAMRERYGKMFAEKKNLHCIIENRIVIGNKVIDKERVLGLATSDVHAVAIYEIKDGKIIKCWFLRG